jgi:hypothetical protein
VSHELGQGVQPFKPSKGSHFSIAQNKINLMDRIFSILHTSQNLLCKFSFTFSGESTVIIKKINQNILLELHTFNPPEYVICMPISLDECLTSAHTVGWISATGWQPSNLNVLAPKIAALHTRIKAHNGDFLKNSSENFN